ncbi:MAG: hypothetical protein KK482_24800 [Sinorhizobium meliloti]|nr:hypothetical protein [Sinorhizobium meliloti]
MTVEFLNDNIVYGVERYAIEAMDVSEAQRLALKRSEDSRYDEDRVPDRWRRALVTVTATTDQY